MSSNLVEANFFEVWVFKLPPNWDKKARQLVVEAAVIFISVHQSLGLVLKKKQVHGPVLHSGINECKCVRNQVAFGPNVEGILDTSTAQENAPF